MRETAAITIATGLGWFAQRDGPGSVVVRSYCARCRNSAAAVMISVGDDNFSCVLRSKDAGDRPVSRSHCTERSTAAWAADTSAHAKE